MVLPGETVWVDVAIPRGDPLWDLDVGRAFVWLGRAWARALDSLGLGPADVHEGAMVRSAWSGHMCFAGLGPGEVSVAGRKVVGLSQRRSREGAVFSCAAYLSHDPGVLPALLALDDGARLQASAALGAMAAPLGAMSCGPQRGPAGCDEVEKALLAAMVQGGPGLAWALAG